MVEWWMVEWCLAGVFVRGIWFWLKDCSDDEKSDTYAEVCVGKVENPWVELIAAA